MSRGVWFQQDGATAHTAKQYLTSLRGQFKGRLISRFGDVPWPPRSPDLTVPDYYLWGYPKDNVYRNKPKTVHDLKRNITEMIHGISEETLQTVMKSMPARMQSAVKSRGKYLKDIIFKK